MVKFHSSRVVMGRAPDSAFCRSCLADFFRQVLVTDLRKEGGILRAKFPLSKLTLQTKSGG